MTSSTPTMIPALLQVFLNSLVRWGRLTPEVDRCYTMYHGNVFDIYSLSPKMDIFFCGEEVGGNIYVSEFSVVLHLISSWRKYAAVCLVASWGMKDGLQGLMPQPWKTETLFCPGLLFMRHWNNVKFELPFLKTWKICMLSIILHL
jgi:hypothetical protein